MKALKVSFPTYEMEVVTHVEISLQPESTHLNTTMGRVGAQQTPHIATLEPPPPDARCQQTLSTPNSGSRSTFPRQWVPGLLWNKAQTSSGPWPGHFHRTFKCC